MKRSIRRAAFRSAGLAFCLPFVLPASARAQVSFSITYKGPTITQLATGVARPLTAGDILTPATNGVPEIAGGNPLPVPSILIGGGQTGGLNQTLGLQTHDDCINSAPGVRCTAELDALSYGRDDLVADFNSAASFSGIVTATADKGRWRFSVDEFAEGIPGLPQDPSVESENRLVVAAGIRAGDSSADIFTDLGFAFAPPIGPLDPRSGNIGLIDGNGARSLSSFFVYSGVGLTEPNAPVAPPGATPGDDVDALDVGGAAFPGADFPVFYSLDSAFFDPKTLAANNGTAIAEGFVGGDVVVTPMSGSPPALYASAAVLGLDGFGGPDSDDVDALLLRENAVPGYQPSTAAYDWLDGSTDMLMFSLRRGSGIILAGASGNPAAVDSIFGLPIEEGDILVPPVAGGNGNPGIFIAAEVIGLRTLRNFDPCGDDLDGLDYQQSTALIAQEYCYGDGGIDIDMDSVPDCTPCPCGNNMPPNTLAGCMNSSGTGARLEASGIASVSADTLRFEMTGGNPSTFGVLVSGDNRLPIMGPCIGAGLAQPMLLDGLRCIGGNLLRNGARATDATGSIGITNNGWGPPNGPPGGILAARGLVDCQTRQFQVFYREVASLVCMNGQNTSNAVQVTVTP